MDLNKIVDFKPNLQISTKYVDFQNCFPDVALFEVEREMRIFSNFDKIHGFQAKSVDFEDSAASRHQNLSTKICRFPKLTVSMMLPSWRLREK